MAWAWKSQSSWPADSSSTTQWDNWSRHDEAKQSTAGDAELGLPQTFISDALHLDSQKQPTANGIPLMRKIESTPWTRKAGLNGREVSSVKLHELAYRGWHEQSLRHLSQGRFVSLLFCGSV